MSNKFNWSNFEVDFLKSILNSDKTDNKLRPTFDADEAFELAPFVEAIVTEQMLHRERPRNNNPQIIRNKVKVPRLFLSCF